MAARFRSIRVKARDEFDHLIEHLTHEAYRARDNWDFWDELEKACNEYSIELNETPAFWELTRRAHKDAVVLRLGRLYDPHATAISLGNLLQTIKENAGGVGWVPTPLAGLDIAELDSEIDAVSDEDSVVARLLKIRNEYLAHRGTSHVAKGTFASLPTLERKDFATLMTRALDILGKYRERLGYSRLSWGHHEAEEFRRLLSLVRAGLKSKISI
jgi:AbiU2